MNRQAEELRALSVVDLKAELEATHKELFTTRFRLATRQLNNSWEMVKARKRIARIKTILRERELAGATE